VPPVSLEKHPRHKERASFAVESPLKRAVLAAAITDWPKGQCNALA